MNKKSIFYKIGSIVLLSFLILLILYLLGKNEKTLELQTERIFKDKITLKNTFDLNKKVSLMKYFNNSIYFVSWSKNEQGKLFEMESNKESNFNNLTDSLLIGDYFIEGNKYFIYNKLKNELLEINKSGNLIKTTEFSISVSRLFKNGKKLLLTDWDSDYKFRRFEFDYNENQIEELEFSDSNLKNYALSGIALDGFFYYNNSSIINLPFSLSCAYVFDKNFEFVKRINLIYEPNEFNYQITSNGDIILDSNNIHPNLSGAIDDSYLYVLVDSGTTSKNNNNFFIDVYNIDSGNYIKSYSIEKFKGISPSYFIVNDNKLYLSFGQYINKYSL